jgi:hypothetical protein
VVAEAYRIVLDAVVVNNAASYRQEDRIRFGEAFVNREESDHVKRREEGGVG